MVFASAQRLYVGTMNGRVYRYDEAGGAWTQTRIDDDGGLPSTFAVPVTDIAVDPNDSTGASIYITFGGMLNDARRVWRYNGSTWASASGTRRDRPARRAVRRRRLRSRQPDTRLRRRRHRRVAEHELGRHLAGVLRGSSRRRS